MSSPNPALLGAGRTGALRADDNFVDSFYIAVDLVDWDDSIEQDVGILAMVREPGAGTLDCYAFSYDVDSQRFFLTRLDDEGAVTPVKLSACGHLGLRRGAQSAARAGSGVAVEAPPPGAR